MAHELTIREDGTAEAAFAGAVPWHGLGYQTDGHMFPQDALDKAQMRWFVRKVPVGMIPPTPERGADLYPVGFAEKITNDPLDDFAAVVRDDNGLCLGIVSKGYTPIQNEEQAYFIEGLTENGAVVECVGSLYGGAKTFWTCKLPESLMIGGEDQIDRYLILANGHDGKLSFRAFWSPIRVVCQNTLNAALSGAKSVCLYHTLNVHRRFEEASKALGLANSYYNRLEKAFNEFKAVGVDDETLTTYIEKVFPTPDGTVKATQMRNLETTRGLVRANFYADDMAGRTVWGAYNGVTQYLDHQKGNGKVTQESKFQSVLMGGQIFTAQQRAFKIACELVESVA